MKVQLVLDDPNHIVDKYPSVGYETAIAFAKLVSQQNEGRFVRVVDHDGFMVALYMNGKRRTLQAAPL